MAGRILLISKGAAFMANAVEANLKKAGFDTMQVPPIMTDVTKNAESTDIILLFAGEYLYDAADIMVYIKDICTEQEKLLCVIGYENEIALVKETIPETIIAREIKRPFDVKALTGDMETLYSSDAERRKGKHILLVDDDATFLKMMQGWLSMKYKVSAVKSGMQAIKFITVNRPDLILLDYDMPVTNGLQILEMIKSEPDTADIPVIFLTGKSDRDSIISVMQLRPDGYLLKSTSKENIMDTVVNFFETRKWKEISK